MKYLTMIVIGLMGLLSLDNGTNLNPTKFVYHTETKINNIIIKTADFKRVPNVDKFIQADELCSTDGLCDDEWQVKIEQTEIQPKMMYGLSVPWLGPVEVTTIDCHAGGDFQCPLGDCDE